MIDGNDAWCGVGEGSAVGIMDYEGEMKVREGRKHLDLRPYVWPNCLQSLSKRGQARQEFGGCRGEKSVTRRWKWRPWSDGVRMEGRYLVDPRSIILSITYRQHGLEIKAVRMQSLAPSKNQWSAGLPCVAH